MTTEIDPDVLPAVWDALTTCTRAADLLLHRVDPLTPGSIGANSRYAHVSIWATGFDGPLSPEVFPFPDVSDVPPELPPGTRRALVDILAFRHDGIWSECFVQIRSALHIPVPEDPEEKAQVWTFRLDRSVQRATAEPVDWPTAIATLELVD